jgi:hypothetical protein
MRMAEVRPQLDTQAYPVLDLSWEIGEKGRGGSADKGEGQPKRASVSMKAGQELAMERSEIRIDGIAMPLYSLNTVVIGSGAASLNAAVNLVERGRRCR